MNGNEIKDVTGCLVKNDHYGKEPRKHSPCNRSVSRFFFGKLQKQKDFPLLKSQGLIYRVFRGEHYEWFVKDEESRRSYTNDSLVKAVVVVDRSIGGFRASYPLTGLEYGLLNRTHFE